MGRVIPLRGDVHEADFVDTSQLDKPWRSTIPPADHEWPDTYPSLPAEAVSELGLHTNPPRSSASLWTRIRRWGSVVRWRFYR